MSDTDPDADREAESSEARTVGGPSSLEGQVALVLGGTRGIGLGISRSLAAAGAHVVISGRALGSASKVADDLRAEGGDVSAAAIDVSDSPAAAAAIDRVVEAHGRLDVLVVNAGVNARSMRAEELTYEAWDELMSVNLRGAFFAVQAAARHMLARGAGSIVSISSTTASLGVPRGMPYVASKGGLDAMTRTLGVEWGRRGVRVNGVAPGYVATDLTAGLRDNARLSEKIEGRVPLGRYGEPADIAEVVTFLASPAARYVTGQTWVVDGGYAIV